MTMCRFAYAFVFVACLGLAAPAWPQDGAMPDGTPATAAPADTDRPHPKKHADNADDFTCAGKTKCAQMDSCAEARFYLRECGVTRLDRDHDGVPCESICR